MSVVIPFDADLDALIRKHEFDSVCHFLYATDTYYDEETQCLYSLFTTIRRDINCIILNEKYCIDLKTLHAFLLQ